MKLTMFLLTIGMLSASAKGVSQQITFSGQSVPLKTVFGVIEKQTGYVLLWDNDLLPRLTPVSVQARKMDLRKFLQLIFSDQPVDYMMDQNTIFLSVKTTITKTKEDLVVPFIPITGIIKGGDGLLLAGASVRVKGTGQLSVTDERGAFFLNVNLGDILVISYIGFETREWKVTDNTTLNIVLARSEQKMDTATISLNTGFQSIPKERATGSFVFIDSTLLSRNVGTNVLDRLDGIAAGIRFDYSQVLGNVQTAPNGRNTGLTVRGASTLNYLVGTEPLIVLDNFPYEGELSNINPNNIESVTILKDAAAASIWGARAGNGVIVLTSKKGKRNGQFDIEVSSNVTVHNKPLIYEDKNYIPSADYIDLETDLFKKGYYNAKIANTTSFPYLSPVVEILANNATNATQKQAALDNLKQNDLRRDMLKYLYRKEVYQQYAISIRGGSSKVSHTFSVGYDKNLTARQYTRFNRFTMSSNNIYTPLKGLDITAGINYTMSKKEDAPYPVNGLSYQSFEPYARLADDQGNPLPVGNALRRSYVDGAVAKGFLDWNYRPIDEFHMTDYYTKVSDLLFRTSVKYKFSSFLSADIQYQMDRQMVNNHNYQSVNTYAMRTLINQFTRFDPVTKLPTYPFPMGGKLELGEYPMTTHNLRSQVYYDQTFRQKHSINAIAGAEIRSVTSEQYFRQSYGYDDALGTAVTNLDYINALPVNPSGSLRIPAPDGEINGYTYRYVSYYGNAAYSYDKRFTVTASARKDGANILGVSTNQKFKPLWSAGLGWNLSNESFYKLNWLPYLRVRATYGYNGNVYNGTAYTKGSYYTTKLARLPSIINLTPPNPQLTWERVRNINLGIDFSLKNNVVSGTIEFYSKNCQDLIDNVKLAPSSGFTSFIGNSGQLKSKGVDVTVTSNNLKGRIQWQTTLLLSVFKDKLVKYSQPFNSYYASSYMTGIIGKPVTAIYSYQWKGLDPVNGDPQGVVKGAVSKDYSSIINNTALADLVYHGPGVPTYYGALRNDLRFKGFSLSVNIGYELGYYFKRKTVNLNESNLVGSTFYKHSDFGKRWQKPGDELISNVPSVIYPSNSNRSTFYQNSSVIVEKGDNIRLRDIRLAYSLNKGSVKQLPFKQAELFGYVTNLGLLWRANKQGIDPGFQTMPLPFSLSFGLNIKL